MASRVTQEVLEAVRQPSPSARSTQEVLEVVLLTGTAGGTVASAGQNGTAEVISAVTGSGGTETSADQDGTAYLPGVLVTQEVLEAVVSGPAGANVLVTQETLETVLQPSPAVRSSQEVLEVVVEPGTTGGTEASAEQSGTATAEGGAAVTGSFVVETEPRVFWQATVPVNEFVVRERPRVYWDAGAEPAGNAFTVHTAPVVKWNTGPGVADTKCVSADGVVPPRDEPPPASTEENYVF